MGIFYFLANTNHSLNQLKRKLILSITAMPMRHNSKTNNPRIILMVLICVGVLFLSSCAKQGASEKDVAKASPPPPAAAIKEEPAATAAAPAQTAPSPAEGSSTGQRLVLVSTLNGLETNNEFQRNLDLVQSQRQLAISLNDQIALATTDETRAALQEQYDQALAKLNENNKIMLQNYGYSLNRNYVRVIDKSQIFMAVTDEEAANFEANRKRREEENQPSE